ncbi:hypothetical protein F5B17DRAFT_386846 [Nemania serpens]|nr:hypothetical protein F5B17DRAFT_386846 [Nemania serpens]
MLCSILVLSYLIFGLHISPHLFQALRKRERERERERENRKKFLPGRFDHGEHQRCSKRRFHGFIWFWGLFHFPGVTVISRFYDSSGRAHKRASKQTNNTKRVSRDGMVFRDLLGRYGTTTKNPANDLDVSFNLFQKVGFGEKKSGKGGRRKDREVER